MTIKDQFSHLSPHQKWRKRHPERARKSDRDRNLRYKINNPRGSILKRVKQRAKTAGMEFNLTLEDIVIPEYCPVLGMKLERTSSNGAEPNAPSVDRIDNNRGYTKDNICIISWRANSIKRDATIEELEKVLKYMKEYVPSAGL